MNFSRWNIQGIHNVFIVIPQFLVTGLSAIIFAVLDPVPTPSGGAIVPQVPPSGGNATSAATRDVMSKLAGAMARDLTKYSEEAERNERGGQSNSIVYILR